MESVNPPLVSKPPPCFREPDFLRSRIWPDLGVLMWIYKGKARRRREKIAILGTLNGDFQRGIAQKMSKIWSKSLRVSKPPPWFGRDFVRRGGFTDSISPDGRL